MQKKYKINSKIIRLTMNNGDQINGSVNIERNDGYDRVSDLITHNDEMFLVLMNATVHQRSAEKGIRYKTIFVNKNHIIWASPDEDER